MIKKLQNKISLIIVLAISIPLIFIVGIYSYSYYNNVVKTNAQMIDKFFGERDNLFFDKDNLNDMSKIYSVDLEHFNIVNSSNNINSEIEDYTLKIINNKNEYGIVGNYIYKKRVREIKDGNISIIFIESSNEIQRIKIVVISSIVFLLIGIILIYFLSKKLSELITKPVEDTFTKQKEFISDASHELKTPLAVIQANADVLEGDIGNNRWLKYIQNETENMDKI